MEAKEIINNKFDNIKCKGFNEYDIFSELGSIPEDKKNIFENSSEWLAFSLQEGYNNEWGTYYGPIMKKVDNSYLPPKEMINDNVLQYWEKRIDEVSNPILKARYSGLLVDFKGNCGGSIREIHIKSIIDIIKGNYHKWPLLGVIKIQRAFRLAVESKNQEFISEIKRLIPLYEELVAKDNEAAIWGNLFMIMLNNRQHFTQKEIDDYVERLENRLKILANKDINGAEPDFNPFVVEEAVNLLVLYYNKTNDKANLRRVLDTLYNSFHKAEDWFCEMQRQMIWAKLYRLFSKYQYKEKADVILTELQNQNKNVLDEMSMYEIPYEISQEQLKKYVNDMTSGTSEDIFARFIVQFMPNKKESKELLLEISKSSLLIAFCPTQLYDYKGRPSCLIDSIENDIEGNLVLLISKSLRVDALFIRHVIKENINKGNFSKESIMHFLQDCPFFEIDRFEIIAKGIEAYINEDYLLMIHLLIPQIENAIRNIVELSGRSTLESTRSGKGFQLMSLDSLLRDEAILQISEDIAYYLRILFTDPRGWNLRNIVCHGLSQYNFFNSMTADRVFHSLLLIGSIKNKR